jgi:hypothetical protein
MEKKVVVLSPEDVAAMRKANKEAEAAYFEAKVGALEFVADEMRNTGREYTATELANMSGLSPLEVAKQVGTNGCCRAARQAGFKYGEVQTAVRFNELKYVQVMPSGEINPDRSITVTRKQVTYKMRPIRR